MKNIKNWRKNGNFLKFATSPNTKKLFYFVANSGKKISTFGLPSSDEEDEKDKNSLVCSASTKFIFASFLLILIMTRETLLSQNSKSNLPRLNQKLLSNWEFISNFLSFIEVKKISLISNLKEKFSNLESRGRK